MNNLVLEFLQESNEGLDRPDRKFVLLETDPTNQQFAMQATTLDEYIMRKIETIQTAAQGPSDVEKNIQGLDAASQKTWHGATNTQKTAHAPVKIPTGLRELAAQIEVETCIGAKHVAA